MVKVNGSERKKVFFSFFVLLKNSRRTPKNSALCLFSKQIKFFSTSFPTSSPSFLGFRWSLSLLTNRVATDLENLEKSGNLQVPGKVRKFCVWLGNLFFGQISRTSVMKFDQFGRDFQKHFLCLLFLCFIIESSRAYPITKVL